MTTLDALVLRVHELIKSDQEFQRTQSFADQKRASLMWKHFKIDFVHHYPDGMNFQFEKPEWLDD